MTDPSDAGTAWGDESGGCPVGRRRRGAALEQAIHSAALAQLAKHGLGALTMEGVAAAARTGKAVLYRRWACKEDLVLDALGCGMPNEDDFTGSSGHLRDDLIFAFTGMARFIGGPGGAILRNLMSSTGAGNPLLDMARTRLIEPRLDRLRRLIELGVQRGEARPSSATRTLAQVGPAVVLHRFLLYGRVTDEDVREIVDDVVLPLLQGRSDDAACAAGDGAGSAAATPQS